MTTLPIKSLVAGCFPLTIAQPAVCSGDRDGLFGDKHLNLDLF